jgi:large subunit ribosomal protein L10
VSREKKIKSLDYLRQIFDSFKLLIILDIHKISAEEIRKLRRLLNSKSLNLKVFNNKLCKYAIKDSYLNVMSNMLIGQIAIIWDNNNNPTAAQVLKEFQEDIIDLKVKCGIHNGKLIDNQYIKSLSNIPDLSILRIKIINLLSKYSINIIQNLWNIWTIDLLFLFLF